MHFRMNTVFVVAACLAARETAGAFVPSIQPSVRQQSIGETGLNEIQPFHTARSVWRNSAGVALHMSNRRPQERRQVLSLLISMAATTLSSSRPSCASSDAEVVQVYFGCGCFWHVQHELVRAEQRILGREGSDLSARAGYAGGSGVGRDGKVCYHNAEHQSEYASLGHAEVVALQIPPSSFPAFAAAYAHLFSTKGYRPDQLQDRGSEYRNLVGIPGGLDSPLAAQLVRVSQATGDKLNFAAGRGQDFDARALVFIMDSNLFPFFEAEQYHQFHDGFRFGENYPEEYNALGSFLARQGRLSRSLCPRGVLPVGQQ